MGAGPRGVLRKTSVQWGKEGTKLAKIYTPEPRTERSRFLDKFGAENISSILSAMDPKAEGYEGLSTGGRRGESLSKLVHRTYDYWRRLPYSHWPMLFGLYNVSVYSSYLSLLPPISLNMVISPDAAVQLRSPNEQGRKPWIFFYLFVIFFSFFITTI